MSSSTVPSGDAVVEIVNDNEGVDNVVQGTTTGTNEPNRENVQEGSRLRRWTNARKQLFAPNKKHTFDVKVRKSTVPYSKIPEIREADHVSR